MAPTSKYERIMKHSRDQLAKRMQHDPELRDALANSVHAAHVGGYLDMRPSHHKYIGHQGGGLSFDIGGVGKIFNKIV